jgi:hypothetical protein
MTRSLARNRPPRILRVLSTDRRLRAPGVQSELKPGAATIARRPKEGSNRRAFVLVTRDGLVPPK